MAGGGLFDRGQYQMGSLPSRHIMEKDQKAHGTLRLRSVAASATDTEAELKRLKRELELREAGKAAAVDVVPPRAVMDDVKAKAAAFADEDASDSSSSSSALEEGESDKEDDDDEEEELKRELAKIKEEREAAERAAAEAAGSNPLLNTAVRKRWDDDVIFRNQAKDEPRVEKRFINDTIRSECVFSLLSSVALPRMTTNESPGPSSSFHKA